VKALDLDDVRELAGDARREVLEAERCFSSDRSRINLYRDLGRAQPA
jgi:hypothetical protein